MANEENTRWAVLLADVGKPHTPATICLSILGGRPDQDWRPVCTTQVADPWNDPWIAEETFPNIPDYPHTDYGIATVLQTGQSAFEWPTTEQTWQRPDVNHLMIYELLIRDFGSKHSFQEMLDTLAYIKNLGVDAIEIMPFSEFEGNESWGIIPTTISQWINTTALKMT
ncbi:MAG: hypothetical protein R2795_09885 [Saprospiraceae bacterium]